MVKEILMVRDIEIEKKKFYCDLFLKDLDIENVLVSNKISSGYLHNDYTVKPLNIMLPKTSAYVKSYDGETKWMYFFIEDDDLLKKYNTIWDKVSADIKK